MKSYLLANYKVYRSDRADGILIGVACDILSDAIDAPSHLEVCSVSLKISRSLKLIVICATSC